MNLIIKINLDNVKGTSIANIAEYLDNTLCQVFSIMTNIDKPDLNLYDSNGNTVGTVEVTACVCPDRFQGLIPIPNPCWDKPEQVT